MAINLEMYSNANSVTRSITIDFFADMLSDSPSSAKNEVVYYFKLSTGARDASNIPYNIKIVRGLSDLALNRVKQSGSDSSNSYVSIDEMVRDHIYDYVHGHTANQFSSGVAVKAPMKF